MATEPHGDRGSHPGAGLPGKNSGRTLVLLGIVLLALAGAGVAWKLSQSEAQPDDVAPPKAASAAEPAAAEAPPAPELAEAPPPPPPLDEAAAPLPPGSLDNLPNSSPTLKMSGGCPASCTGRETPALLSALRAKATQARGCYNRALRQNSTLSGKLRVETKVNSRGAACSVRVVEDTIKDPAVKSCVTEIFRNGTYPPPQGACVTLAAPLSFVAKE
jgi:hypothetical protein